MNIYLSISEKDSHIRGKILDQLRNWFPNDNVYKREQYSDSLIWKADVVIVYLTGGVFKGTHDSYTNSITEDVAKELKLTNDLGKQKTYLMYNRVSDDTWQLYNYKINFNISKTQFHVYGLAGPVDVVAIRNDPKRRVQLGTRKVQVIPNIYRPGFSSIAASQLGIEQARILREIAKDFFDYEILGHSPIVRTEDIPYLAAEYNSLYSQKQSETNVENKSFKADIIVSKVTNSIIKEKERNGKKGPILSREKTTISI